MKPGNCYSFDDRHIGLTDPSRTFLKEKLVERPPGLDNRTWYQHAGQVCRLLNKEPPAL